MEREKRESSKKEPKPRKTKTKLGGELFGKEKELKRENPLLGREGQDEMLKEEVRKQREAEEERLKEEARQMKEFYEELEEAYKDNDETGPATEDFIDGEQKNN